MNSNSIIRKTVIASFAVIAIGAGSMASVGHSYAKESGEQGGTEDINIGVGELQEWNASKSITAGENDGPSKFEIQVRMVSMRNAESSR